MKAKIGLSGNIQRRNQGKRPWFEISLEPENEAETALLRIAGSARSTRYHTWEDGTAEIQFAYPRVAEDSL